MSVNDNKEAKMMTFGQAIEALKAGKRVSRAGWNGKGMWLALTKKFVPTGDLPCQPYIVMWTAAAQWQPGWLASQADMLAEDWQVVEE